MCGRVVLEINSDQVAKQFNAKFELEQLDMYKMGFNIAPSQKLCVINNEDGHRIGRVMRWGLIPPWIKSLGDMKMLTINARSETITESKLYAPPFRKNRCLVIVSGYYEWKKISSKVKQPYFFRAADGGAMAFAGLWGKTRLKHDDQTYEDLESCTIITCTPNEAASEIHDRMPVILMPKDYDTWMNPNTSEVELISLLKPCPEEFLEIYRVAKEVGNTRNDSPRNIEQIPDEDLAF